MCAMPRRNDAMHYYLVLILYQVGSWLKTSKSGSSISGGHDKAGLRCTQIWLDSVVALVFASVGSMAHLLDSSSSLLYNTLGL